MSKRFRACFRWLKKAEMTAGKVTLFAVLAGAIISATTLAAYFEILVPVANANNVNTSVTVLNTPPQWTINAHELVASATSTPTNAGARLYFTGKADDSSLDNYWLIICKTAVAPTPHVSAAPTCNGGNVNQWAVSSETASGVTITVGTTTTEGGQFVNESNDWYGWVCDGNVTLPRCNATYANSDPTDTAPSGGTGYPDSNSPFVINHPPAFTLITNTSPKDPGQVLTWTATATDTDHLRGIDPLTLYVCKAADFATSTGCGAGGSWAISSPSSTSTVSTSTTIVIPSQDKTYSAFTYIEDNNFEAATSSVQGTNSSYVVNNVAPTVDAASIVVGTSSGDIILTRPQATSGPFVVKFTVTDNNSCLNSSSGNEISSVATTSVYRSGITQNSCKVSGDFDSNSCYTSANAPMTNFVCTQDAGSCSGSSDSTATWTCTYSLWYNADATDVNAVYAAENWLASVQVKDDNSFASSFTESSTGNDLDKFLAFDVSQSSISYGGLQPGDQIDPLSVATTTNLLALGNVGLDENLYGDTMCTNWSGADTCDTKHPVPSATSTIPVLNQKFATSTVSYATATALTSSSSPTLFSLHVLKTIATSSPQTKDTLWAIKVPAAITLAGSYSGQNSIIAATSPSAYW